SAGHRTGRMPRSVSLPPPPRRKPQSNETAKSSAFQELPRRRQTLFWQIQADVQFAQLLLRDLGGRAHQQILGALVHRDQDALAQVLLAAQKHHDAVDARRNAAVRGGAERQRTKHAPEFLLQHILAIAGDGKGLLHHVGTVISDRTRRQFDTVADDVVLDRLEAEDLVLIRRIKRQKLIRRHIRHREWIVREVDLLLLFVPFVHREVDDPAELETVLGRKPKLAADFVAGGTGKFHKVTRLPGDEEHRVTDTKAELVAQRAGALGAKVLRNRARSAIFAFPPKNIAEPGLSLALRPFIHAIAKGTIATCRRRNAPHLDSG